MSTQFERAISESSIIAANQDVTYATDLGEEMVLLNLNKGEYYGMNPIAGQIWSLIQEPRTVKEIQDAILTEYDVEVDRCEKDLLTLLTGLADEQLIEVTNEKSVSVSAHLQ